MSLEFKYSSFLRIRIIISSSIKHYARYLNRFHCLSSIVLVQIQGYTWTTNPRKQKFISLTCCLSKSYIIDQSLCVIHMYHHILQCRCVHFKLKTHHVTSLYNLQSISLFISVKCQNETIVKLNMVVSKFLLSFKLLVGFRSVLRIKAAP